MWHVCLCGSEIVGTLHFVGDGALGLVVPVSSPPHQLPRHALRVTVSWHGGRTLTHETVHQHVSIPHLHMCVCVCACVKVES